MWMSQRRAALVLLAPLAALFALVAPAIARAEGPVAKHRAPAPKAGWETWQLEDGPRRVTVEVLRDERSLPLVVFAPGSHCLPVFFTSPGPNGPRSRSTLPFDAEAARKMAAFHFAVVERKGFASFGAIEDVKAVDHCTEAVGGVDKEERAGELALAARALRGEPWAASIVLAGHSEGADVAAGAARLLGPGGALGVGFLASGGVTQFFDLVMIGRRRGDSAAAQRAFDDLLALTGPSPPSDFEGFPRERFASYAIRSTPLDDLVGLEVPVFVAQGTADTNSAPEAADAMVTELLRRAPSRAVQYLVLDGADHAFNDAHGNGHGEEVLAELVAWATAPHPVRGVTTRFYAKPQGLPSVKFLRMPAWVLALGLLAIGAALVVLRRGRQGSGARLGLASSALLAWTLAGATVGLWTGILIQSKEESVVAVAGALGGALVGLSALWGTTAARA